MEESDRDILLRLESRISRLRTAQTEHTRAIDRQTATIRVVRVNLSDLTSEAATQEERLWDMIQKLAFALAQSDTQAKRTLASHSETQEVVRSLQADWVALRGEVVAPLGRLVELGENRSRTSWREPKNAALLIGASLPVLALMALLALTWSGDLKWDNASWRVPGLVGSAAPPPNDLPAYPESLQGSGPTKEGPL